ncbi:MAG: YraN family protein [Deltaproteobacteria bacterium]|nr:YraN family protein [Deltaproteobacteria bacterium]
MSGAKQRLGLLGEDEAIRALKRHGYKVVCRNYRCSRGEIDVVAMDNGVYVFIEVKTRSDDSFGHPASAVDFRKQRHIADAAAYYLNAHNVSIEEVDIRFDVVSIQLSSGGFATEIIRNAFETE